MILLCILLEAHLTVLVLDLTKMKLKNFRRDIELVDEALYQKCLHDDIISAEVCLFLWV